MSITQRQGVIFLIPQKKKERSILGNWRPISLLNTDYKIATKCIAKRLEKVSLILIANDQTDYVRCRYIGENVRLISDIIDYYEKVGIPGIIIFLDYEKAFDTVEWTYIQAVLGKMNFGPTLKKWFSTSYKNISS